jgi:hypothetical protein
MRISAVLAGVVLFAVPAFAQTPETRKPDLTGVSPALSSFTELHTATAAAAADPYFRPADWMVHREPPRTSTANDFSTSLVTPNSPTTFQTTLGNLPVTVTQNFPGLGQGFNVNWTNQGLVPPDTTMAVGPTQIVQWVNIRLSVMDKSGNPLIGGALGYIAGNAIWSGLPVTSNCRNTNQGDPMVQYDRIADRWVLSQFAFTLATATNGSGRIYPAVGSYRQCIAVSTTGDATGTYALYEYSYPSLPDYPKLGVWPDGGNGSYVVTSNDFSFSTVTGLSSFVGARICGYDRAALVAGNPATGICFAGMTNRFSLIPSDLDGSTPPPAGAPNYVVSQDWFFFNSPPYSVRLQKLHLDFATPVNSTFTDGIGGGFNSFIQLPVGSLLGACGDSGGACVPQPTTVRVLDTLSMRPMYRLAYRNRGPGQESLVFTHSIDPPGSAVAGMNWIELRNPGANPPSIYQNGALNPSDGVNRWMGSGAMDKVGNIAIGYSVSSGAVFPGIRIAGRYRTDVRSTMRGELNVVTGTGAQTTAAQRWGDYSAMQVDPTDDCTFWYTQEYYAVTSLRDWATRIIAFKFPNCQ